jgi:hypothetical protein
MLPFPPLHSFAPLDRRAAAPSPHSLRSFADSGFLLDLFRTISELDIKNGTVRYRHIDEIQCLSRIYRDNNARGGALGNTHAGDLWRLGVAKISEERRKSRLEVTDEVRQSRKDKRRHTAGEPTTAPGGNGLLGPMHLARLRADLLGESFDEAEEDEVDAVEEDEEDEEEEEEEEEVQGGTQETEGNAEEGEEEKARRENREREEEEEKQRREWEEEQRRLDRETLASMEAASEFREGDAVEVKCEGAW